jgi:tetratricopeptide (TPR) repeat protein
MSATIARALLGVGLLGACSACSTGAGPVWMPSSKEARQVEAVPARAAASTPERDVRSERAEALYRLGLLQADPTSGLRDYRAARDTFTRLLSEYPRSRWDAEARAWQATLTDLLVREDEARRYSQRVQRLEEDSKRTKTNLEWLKQTDLDRGPGR